VILDEYVKNRDVWRCPSAKLEKGVTVVITAQPTWLKYWLDHEGLWGRVSDCDGGGPCGVAWPTGWGGTITDSIVQGQCSGPDTNHFAQSVGTSDAENLKTSQIEDASWYVVCGDTGGQVELWSPLNIAYVEACGANACGTCCGTSPAVGGCCAGDWANCSWSADCGYLDAPVKTKFWTDASIRKQYTRHLGGSNIGFADGHASWMMADALVAAGPTSWDPNRGKIRGIGCSCVPDRMM
jgi:prepilin-type processing-associated H-X9-DG protein